ncbi:MAG: peptidyl-prolyl cis-trans isomerase [Thermodesulfobacteriota bacterium]
MRVARSPLARLLLGGALLVAGERALARRGGPEQPARETLRIAAAHVDAAVRAFVARTGRSPDERERAALVAGEVDEEILYREALARGLGAHDAVVQQRLVSNMAFVAGDEDARAGAAASDAGGALHRDALALGMEASDLVVRRRLVDRMRALLEGPAAAPEPSEQELEQAVAGERDRFVRPERVRVSQVLLRRAAAGGDAGAGRAAERLLAAGLPDPARHPDAVARAGDPSSLPTHLPLQGEHDLARLFGASFARAAVSLPVGRWSGPVASSHGAHLVWVHERVAAEPLPLDAVRGQVTELVRRRRARAALVRALDGLRARYEVVVEGGAPEGAG